MRKKFDKIFIGFVIHGFPHHVRQSVIENAYKHLEAGGAFYILDFAEFDMNSMPFHHHAIFKAVEYKYAFDYMESGILYVKGIDAFDSVSEILSSSTTIIIRFSGRISFIAIVQIDIHAKQI